MIISNYSIFDNNHNSFNDKIKVKSLIFSFLLGTSVPVGIQLSSIPFTSASGIHLSSQHQSMEQQQQHHMVTSMAGQHQQLLGQMGSGNKHHREFKLYDI